MYRIGAADEARAKGRNPARGRRKQPKGGKEMTATYGDLMEGTDKALFMDWLHMEIGIFGEMETEERKREINLICQRWIKHKISEYAECADCGSTGHDTGSNTCPGPE